MRDRLLTLPEVASLLRISNGSVYNYINTRNLPAIKIGRNWRFKAEQIKFWISQQNLNSPNFINSLNN